jgi:hypothetical protein
VTISPLNLEMNYVTVAEIPGTSIFLAGYRWGSARSKPAAPQRDRMIPSK